MHIFSKLAVLGAIGVNAVEHKFITSIEKRLAEEKAQLEKLQSEHRQHMSQLATLTDTKSIKDSGALMEKLETLLGKDVIEGHEDKMAGAELSHKDGSYHHEVKQSQERSEHAAKHMSHDEALHMLKGKLSAVEHDKLESVVKMADSSELATGATQSEKDKLVAAMKALNDMYLSIDEKRIRMVTECGIDMEDNLFQRTGYWKDFKSYLGEANVNMQRKGSSDTEKDDSMNMMGMRKDNYFNDLAQYSMKKNAEEEVLAGHRREVMLFRFILKKIRSEGKKSDTGFAGATSSGEKKSTITKLMQDAKDSMKDAATSHTEEWCKSSDGLRGRLNANKALINVFADPEVLKQAEGELHPESYKQLKSMLSNVRSAESEEVAEKYRRSASSFLQVSQDPSQSSETAETGAGALCSSQQVNVDAMRVIVGQELECRYQNWNKQNQKLQAMAEEWSKSEKWHSDIIKTALTNANAHEQSANGFMQEVLAYLGMSLEAFKAFMKWNYDFEFTRKQCMLNLFELKENHFCAIKHLRDYFMKLTLDAHSLTEDDVTDCEYSDFMYVEGKCAFASDDNNGMGFTCLDHERLPDNINGFPRQDWKRQLLQTQDTSPAAQKALNGTVALDCPAPTATDMNLPCAKKLCPRNCNQGDTSRAGSCSALCDGGLMKWARHLYGMARFGGFVCQPTEEMHPCGESPCNVDCELHEEYSATEGCAPGCTNHGRMRSELVTKQVKVEPKGTGNVCPPTTSDERSKLSSDCNHRECNGDEVCGGPVDLILAYDCSHEVTKLGCWYMSIFTFQLLRRMPKLSYGMGAIRVGLIMFGNGVSLKQPNHPSYYMQDSVAVHHLGNNNNMFKYLHKMYDMAMNIRYTQDEGEDTKSKQFRIGFNNMGKAIHMGVKMLENADARPGLDTSAEVDKRIVIITKGIKVECTYAHDEAREAKKKGVDISIILVNNKYNANDKNPSFDEMKNVVVSHPPEHNFIPVVDTADPATPRGLAYLGFWRHRNAVASQVIPQICPHTSYSPMKARKKQCDMGIRLVKRSSECGYWKKALAQGENKQLTLQQCAEAAMSEGYTMFQHTQTGGKDHAAGVHYGDVHIGEETQTSASGDQDNDEGTCMVHEPAEENEEAGSGSSSSSEPSECKMDPFTEGSGALRTMFLAKKQQVMSTEQGRKVPEVLALNGALCGKCPNKKAGGEPAQSAETCVTGFDVSDPTAKRHTSVYVVLQNIETMYSDAREKLCQRVVETRKYGSRSITFDRTKFWEKRWSLGREGFW